MTSWLWRRTLTLALQPGAAASIAPVPDARFGWKRSPTSTQFSLHRTIRRMVGDGVPTPRFTFHLQRVDVYVKCNIDIHLCTDVIYGFVEWDGKVMLGKLQRQF